MQTSRVDLFLEGEHRVDRRKLRGYQNRLQRVVKGEHLAFLTRSIAFHNVVLDIQPGVFIPRPETEKLVDLAIEVLKFLKTEDPENNRLKILDLCTGIGNIPIALIRALPEFGLEINATDISPLALKVARDNLRRQGLLAKVFLFKGDLFDCRGLIPEKYDVIVGNPPYYTSKQTRESARGGEPPIGYDGGKDGLASIRKTLEEAVHYLKPKGFLILEIGEDQEEEVLKICRSVPFWKSAMVMFKTQGTSKVLVATPRENFPFSQWESRDVQTTPLIKKKGRSWPMAKNLRILTRELATRIDELRQLKEKLGDFPPTKATQDLGNFIESLISDANKQMDLERSYTGTRGQPPDEFEVLRIHMQALELTDFIDSRGKHRRRFFNLTNLRNKEHHFGSILNFATIFILMDALARRITGAKREQQRISRIRGIREIVNLKGVAGWINQGEDHIDIARAFTLKVRNRFGERLSHTVLTNWDNILFSLGFLILELERKTKLLQRIR